MRLCPTDHQSTTLFVKERDYSSGEDGYDLDSLCLKINPLKLNIQPLYTRFHKKKQRSLIHVYDISHAKTVQYQWIAEKDSGINYYDLRKALERRHSRFVPSAIGQ